MHRGAALAASSRSARACRRSSTAFAARGRRAARQRRLLRHRGAAPRAAGGRRGGRRRGRHVAVLVRRLRQRDRSTSARKPVFVDIDPVTLNLDPDAAAAAITARTTALLPVHIFGYPADMPALERHGLPIVEDACEALGAVHADGVAGRRRAAIRRRSASTPTSSSPPARAACSRWARAEHKERVDSERNQGRAPDMGWLDHDRLGFNYRLTRHRLRARPRAARAARRHARRPRARVAGWYREALAGCRGPRAAVRGRRRRRARLVRVRRPAPARRRPRRHDPRRCASAACSPSRTCPRST